MTLAGRPPVNLGVTSGGNFYGNTQITFTDVLGDKEISFYAQSVAQYRTTAFTYVNTERRMQYALQGFSQDTFYYGQQIRAPALCTTRLSRRYINRDLAEAVQSQRGGTAFVIYPFNRYARAELFDAATSTSTERYTNAVAAGDSCERVPGQTSSAAAVPQRPHDAARLYVRERDDGLPRIRPGGRQHVQVVLRRLAGVRRQLDLAQTLDVDARYYTRLGRQRRARVRFKGFKSWGHNPDFLYFGGNSEMRGYEYLEFIGQRASSPTPNCGSRSSRRC